MEDTAGSQAQVSYQRALAQLANRNLRAALPDLEQSYQLGLRHVAVVLSLAKCRFAAGQDAAAVDLLNGAIQKATTANVLIQSGRLLFDQALYRQSLIAFQKAWKIEPGSYEIGMYLALAHYLLEQYPESEQILAEIRVRGAGTFESLNLYGSVYARLGQFEKAKAIFETLIRQSPERAEGHLSLGLLYLERDDFGKAMEWIDSGARRLQPGTKLFYEVRRRRSCAGLQPPVSQVSVDVTRGKMYSSFALSLQKTRHWQSALEVYLLALKADSSSAAAYGGIGLICQELGTAETGRVFIEQGLRIHPNDPELYYYLGSLQQVLGLGEQAVHSYKSAIALTREPVPARYLLRLGIAQLSTEDDHISEATFREAIERDEAFAPAYHELGKLYLKYRDYERAERYLERAVDLDPLLREAWYAYGTACVRNGKADRGRAILENYQRTKGLRDTKVVSTAE
jgi:tetratricopeptide (TPR) repeat protein